MRIQKRPIIAAILIIVMLLTAACAPTKDRRVAAGDADRLQAVTSKNYPQFTDDMGMDGLVHALQQSVLYLERLSPQKTFYLGSDSYSRDHMIQSAERLLAFIQTHPTPDAINRFIRRYYQLYQGQKVTASQQVLFTGYYEPILIGSPTPDERYRIPVYARPPDLTTIDLGLFGKQWQGRKIVGRYTGTAIVPYYDRQQIETQHVLTGKAEVLAWLEDPVDLFFLQIQGSGKIYLTSGEVLHLHYHGSNGQPYRSIGKLLIDEGKIPRSEMSMQRIRQYLDRHPQELRRILNYNPSFVFFKREDGGPYGAIEVALSPGRSVAVDRRVYPLAALAFVQTEKPLINGQQTIQQWVPLSRFALLQDTGGAIRGARRADLFWGNGPYAEIAAGYMQHPGRLYVLVLRKN
jgi:membrane-bound lytic murein transglycosylase A